MSKYILTISVLLLTSQSIACDVCGAFMGVMPYGQRSSISLMQRYRAYNGYAGQQHQLFPEGVNPFYSQRQGRPHGLIFHDHSEQNNADYEVYRIYELRAKYFLHPRWEVNAFVPYLNNSYKDSHERFTIGGIGDMSMLLGHHLLVPNEENNMQQRLIIGGGIKLPTGDYYLRDARGRYSLLLQPGTGSIDYFTYVNYSLSWGKWMGSLNSMYKFNGLNYYEEGVANSTANYLILAYQLSLGENTTMLPGLRSYYEFCKGEIDEGKLTGEHRMNNILMGPQLDLYHKSFSFNLGLELMVFDEQQDHPQNAGRISIGVNYHFQKEGFLWKKKEISSK